MVTLTAGSFIIWPDLIEINRISLWIRLVTSVVLFLNILAVLFAPNIATEGVPLTQFAGILVAGVLFSTDFERQKQNMLPMLLLIVICLASSVRGLLFGQATWELLGMGILAVTILIGCFIALRYGFVREVKKRFHIR